jgi:phosphotransferase system enzyme I (PtsP)
VSVASELLHDVGRLLTRSHDLRETLDNVVQLVARRMHASACSIYLCEPDPSWLVLRATRGLKQKSVGKVRLRVGQGITGAALEARAPIAVPDVRRDPRMVLFPESGEQKFRSMLAVPLVVGDLPVGVLTFQTSEPHDFKPQEIELLEMIAAQVASIVMNARLLYLASHGGVPGPFLAVEREPAPFPAGSAVRGIASSPGIAIGPVHIQPLALDLDRLDYTPAARKGSEWRAVLRALRETVRQLSDVRQAVGLRFGEEFADVFTTHIMILEDQAFRERLRARVDAHGNGARALVEVMLEYRELFASLRDQTLRERAADIEEVMRRVVGELVGVGQQGKSLGDGVIVVAERVAPGEFALLETEKIAGIVTEHGGPTSHAAIFARSLEIPAISGVTGLLARLRPSDEVIVDGIEGQVIVNPTREQRSIFRERAERHARTRARLDELRGLPALTPDGTEVRLSANIGGLYDLDHVAEYGARGIGLFRTEVLVLSARAIPDEEEQYQLYRRIAERVHPEPVTIRCFDLGGDKLFGSGAEENPQLGWRSVRMLLDRSDVFRAQLRAIVRAGAAGNVRVMIPLVATLDEAEAARELFGAVREELASRAPLPFGVMVETPAAAAIAPHLAARTDFLSIGTNDLVQYTLGADRENERVARLFDPFHPAVLAQIERTAAAARLAGIPCSVCGELAANPAGAPLLVGMGVGELSMAPQSISAVRQMVRSVPRGLAAELARRAIELGRGSEVRAHVASAYLSLGLLDDPDLGARLRNALGKPDPLVDSPEPSR